MKSSRCTCTDCGCEKTNASAVGHRVVELQRAISPHYFHGFWQENVHINTQAGVYIRQHTYSEYRTPLGFPGDMPRQPPADKLKSLLHPLGKAATAAKLNHKPVTNLQQHRWTDKPSTGWPGLLLPCSVNSIPKHSTAPGTESPGIWPLSASTQK